MFDSKKVRTQFEEECTACGLCVECCPIVSHTELRGIDSKKIMEEILDLFQHKKIGDLARTRIYSCLYCNTCIEHCPKALFPAHGFFVGKAILQELGDPVPNGISSIRQLVGGLIENAVSSFRQDPEKSKWLITDVEKSRPEKSKTVLFSSCFALIEGNVLTTTVKILQQIDPDIKVLGGFNNCCGELHLIAGNPEEAEIQFDKMIKGLNILSPENVVIFCPTCNMNFDGRHPDVKWKRTFITDFVAGHLDKLGPLSRVEAAVTVHDPCHFVRGVKPGSESPREILNAIPGVKIIEMENTGENALSCGAYALNGAVRAGLEFRDRRLNQAKATGADILSLYCPGCHMVLGPEGPNKSLRVESILSLLGDSLGIR
ncbi:MAG TPA: heterodisulfide reductase-related iron-sulfur binding cluster [Thermodesulfobacteriota bacterium]|nr:heterodisulfide reductase-related iron-sulfur binding cluster [Thermodesulfobacteriota bacterium]